jgi:hypothetical protein
MAVLTICGLDPLVRINDPSRKADHYKQIESLRKDLRQITQKSLHLPPSSDPTSQIRVYFLESLPGLNDAYVTCHVADVVYSQHALHTSVFAERTTSREEKEVEIRNHLAHTLCECLKQFILEAQDPRLNPREILVHVDRLITGLEPGRCSSTELTR